MEGKCELCEREGVLLTRHHLIPREEGGQDLDVVSLCEPCHKQIHNFYTNTELAVFLNTIPRLRDDEKIKKYLIFIKKQPSSKRIRVKKSKKR